MPLHKLGSNPEAGVYLVKTPREWLVKASPWLRATSAILRSILPVASGLDIAIGPDTGWRQLSEQLKAAEKGIGALSDGTKALGDATDGSALQSLQHTVKELDPSFGGLVRVRERSATSGCIRSSSRYTSSDAPPAPTSALAYPGGG